ncbi:citrate lyase holo-[acyl-carrier protein] synthase [Lacrimispora defluvii]|uniref:citrate lyase holo-[acyl-carrier protein] synthase n=1 Tax=Lacrimispora defluvii TaxID=2719233 RepID=A0ABX1VN32_9FIRM|nr:citrate lyase holo-[acyl-carrier protein] synthase [Lacrimispora defluvii]NNJ29819.1 citrate lyase holo-[acyl-carrier protein] synthase [Lacrimispora defluvii]
MNHYVELEEMLQFRERKARIQEELRRKYKGLVTMTLAMNIPGPIKTSEDILFAFEVGTRSLEQKISDSGIIIKEMTGVSENAGFMKFYTLDCTDPALVKDLAVGLEETHPLGRLWDIDVYNIEGISMSRASASAPARKCFICGQEAKGCARNRTHSVEELMRKVESMIRDYQKHQEE